MADKPQHYPELPVLPLRDVVVYPHMVIPLFVGRDMSIAALEAAMQADKQILLVAQQDAAVDEPDVDELHPVGTVANILQLLRLPDGTVKVLVEGSQRARLACPRVDEDYLIAGVDPLESEEVDEREAEALMRSAMTQFEQDVNQSKKVPAAALTCLSGIDEASRLADTMAAHMRSEERRVGKEWSYGWC